MTLTTLQRLLKYPHAAVFDKDPASELVIRLRHPDGARWTIAAGVMTVTAGATTWTYDLTATTVFGLVGQLRADGFEVLHVSAKFDLQSALVLVEGSGDQNASNGDHIHAFTSLLWVLMSAYSRELDAAGEQVRQALLQMVITTAEGEWLDLWGFLYSVARNPGETDAEYRARIPKEAFRVRVNPRAIEAAIKDITGKDVEIVEPWQSVFTLDKSTLSGSDKFQDDQRIGPFYIQPLSRKPIDWSDVLPVIIRNKPAGIIMLPPQVLYSGSLEVPTDSFASLSIRRRHANTGRLEDLALLDYSAIEEVSVPNYPFIRRRSILHRSGAEIGTSTWPNHPWQPLPWDQLTYFVSSRLWRSYRVYKFSAQYVGQIWTDEPWSDKAWEDLNVIIRTKHSRVSS